MDLITPPLLTLVLGNLAQDLFTEACRDHLKDKVKSVFSWIEAPSDRKKVEHALHEAMKHSYAACLELLLTNIKGAGYTDDELKGYKSSLEAFIKDSKVAEELLKTIREPSRNDLPSPDLLRERWNVLEGVELPIDNLWETVAAAFRRRTTREMILSPDLREILNANNLLQMKEFIQRLGGVRVPVGREMYFKRIKTKFSPVDLANLMPSYVEDPGRMVIRDVFVAQTVRKNPPSVEVPKDLTVQLHEGLHEARETRDKHQIEKLRASYTMQPPSPVLEIVGIPENRLLVLTGDPGSGKSTLLRYLLTGVIEPPLDLRDGSPLPWTQSFKGAFPLLIELRDFYALRCSNKCDNFLEFVAALGNNEGWSLDDHIVDDYLRNDLSLVMFDGLDEIFDVGDRERIIQEIVGFSQRYARARIIVTSRPVGYKPQLLRDAGFVHYGIQDLEDPQIETFVHGWFSLTFPNEPQQAIHRIGRVMSSLRQSKHIRLLAGNPMLLTIMALLAREEELPRERAKFYEKAVDVLCHNWDVNRNLTELPQYSNISYMNADDKKALLRRIAICMQTGHEGLKGNLIQEEDLETEILTFLINVALQPNPVEAKKAARRMIHQLRERNYILCLRGPRLYGFLHRTFLEYFTADEFVLRFDRQPQQMTVDELIDLFDQHCEEDDWHEVLRLICSKINEQYVGRIVEHLADLTDKKTWIYTGLPLAINCLSEARSPAKLVTSGQLVFNKTVEALTSSRYYYASGPESVLMRAISELGARWPGKPDLKQLISQTDCVKGDGRMWCAFIFHMGGDQATILQLLRNNNPNIRVGAPSILVKHWPDETSKTAIAEMLVQDSNEQARKAALTALADTWLDETTQMQIGQCAVADIDPGIRYLALEVLAQKWPSDESSREWIATCVNKEKLGSIRQNALRILTTMWPDECTRNVVANLAVHDEEFHIRRDAFKIMAEKWPEHDATPIILEQGLNDSDPELRSVVLSDLVENRPNEKSRTIVTEIVAKDNSAVVRESALHCLVDFWPDHQTTRAIVYQCAVEDEDVKIREAALSSMSYQWPDERTRELLVERAVSDRDSQPRAFSLATLVQLWPEHETTQKLLATHPQLSQKSVEFVVA